MAHRAEPNIAQAAHPAWAYAEFPNVVPFRPRPTVCFEDSFADLPVARDSLDERRQAIDRLKRRLRRGTVVYVVLRPQQADPDWLVCDFYLISGRSVRRITRDIAMATDCWDPEREIGARLPNPAGEQPLKQLIDDVLSREIFGVPDRIEHRVIE